jgi:hypothetical protein
MALRFAVILLSGVALAAVSAYQAEIAQWRRAREAALQAEGGWLSVAGLFRLHPGINRVGRDEANDIVLPDGPPHAGTFLLQAGKVTASFSGSSRHEDHDSADVVKIGRLDLFVILRGERYGIRLKVSVS